MDNQYTMVTLVLHDTMVWVWTLLTDVVPCTG